MPNSRGAKLVAEKPAATPSNLSQTADIRLRELILHIARQSEGDEAFGAVKLNKLLFAADFTAYVKFGKSITGQDYFALEHGPAPRRLKPVLEQMKDEGEVAIRVDDFHGFRLQRTFALREPDLSKFGPDEIALVDHIIRDCWNRTGTDLSNASHEFIGWKVAQEWEIIPYSVGLVERRELTKSEQEIARKLEEFVRA